MAILGSKVVNASYIRFLSVEIMNAISDRCDNKELVDKPINNRYILIDFGYIREPGDQYVLHRVIEHGDHEFSIRSVRSFRRHTAMLNWETRG